MRLPRQDRQLISGAAEAVEASSTLATAEQAVEVDDVGGSNGIGVGVHEQRRHLEDGDLPRPVVVLAQEQAELGKQYCPVDVRTGLAQGRLLHRLGGRRTHLRKSSQDLGVPSFVLDSHRDDHEFAHHRGMSYCHLQRNSAAERKPITSAFTSPNCPTNAATSSAIASKLSGRSISEVRPR